MKLFPMALALIIATPALAANDRNVTFVENTIQRAQAEFQKPTEQARLQGVCQVLAQTLGNSFISDRWLGRLMFLERETMAVNQLRTMVPSIVFNKFLKNLSLEDTQAKIQVVGESRKKSSGLFEVDLEIVKSSGEKQNLTLVIWTRAGRKLVDFIVNGTSAHEALGAEYGKILQQEYNRDPQTSMPVTALVEAITLEPGYVRCF